MSVIDTLPVRIVDQRAIISAAFAGRYPDLAAAGYNNLLVSGTGMVVVRFIEAHACSLNNCLQCAKETSQAKTLLENAKAPRSAL